MSVALPSVFGIRELFDMVLSLLSTQDLARCVLVNKKWRDAANPYLWRTIHLSTLDQCNAFYSLVLEDYLQAQYQGQQADVDDTKRYQCPGQITAKDEVKARKPSQHASLLEVGPWIRELVNPLDIFQVERMTTIPSAKELLFHFLNHCVNIRALSLSLLSHPSHRSYEFYKAVADSVAPNLRELRLQGSYDGYSYRMSSRYYLYIISRCSAQLEKLTIYNKARPGYVEDTDPDNLPISVANLGGLKELVLDHCWNKDELSSLDWLWRSCGNVERLELRSWDSDETQDLATRIRAYLPKVNSIAFVEEMAIRAIAPLLYACLGGLKNIRAEVTLGRFSCQALTKHCATLEVLQVTSILEFSSEILRHILSSSPKLRTLITSDDKWHLRRWIPYLKAKDFIDAHPKSGNLNPWACETSLEVLKTKIICIPRPDVTKLLSGGLRIDTFKNISLCEGKRIQQRVYERLAKFTNLVELYLGHDRNAKKYPHPDHMVNPCEDYQYECLSMTLESGLDQLKSLRKLRVLDVQGMEQRIGLKEVQWMSQNWPRLRVIRGLCGYGDNLKAAEWLWKHSPMIEVKLASRMLYAMSSNLF